MNARTMATAIVLLTSLALSAVSLPVAGPSGPDPSSQPVSTQAGPAEYIYRDYGTIKDILEAVVAAHPEIAALHDIGDSWEKTEGLSDRDILAIKISDNVDDDEDEPEFLLLALHHAREWPTSETAVELILTLTDGYGSDDRISWLVDNREIWIVPVVNPDGLDFALSSDDMWRKNRRDNLDGTFGVDLNRNYNGSQNDDPLGEWGGAGTSTDTSSSVYCGTSAFSEPETQSIRDLARAHDFQIAFDFHTYGDDVMWPWGYTVDPTPDDEYLVDIGHQLAALNGYDAAQSIALYPTTGDSLDWLYGSLGIFAFLFEMGANDFHPKFESDVLGIINENIPPALLGIELAGDRYQVPFEISHTPLVDAPFSASGYEASAEITASRGVDVSSPKVVFRVDGGSWMTSAMTRGASNDTYAAKIPPQPIGSSVEYYLSAEDLGSVELMNPRYAPYEIHSFMVLDESEPPTAEAGADIFTAVGSTVSFDGSASSDDLEVVGYTWTFVYNASEVSLHGSSPSFVFWTPGAYTVTLNVTDIHGNYDTDTVTVMVEGTAIPEFAGVLVPVAVILVLFALIRARRP